MKFTSVNFNNQSEKTCLNPSLSFSTQFLHIFIVLLHIVSTVLQYMNTVYTNVDPACITDCGYQIVVSSPFVQIIIINIFSSDFSRLSLSLKPVTIL